MNRMLPLLGFLVVAALFGFGIYWTMQYNPREVPSPLIGKPAPAFSLPQLDQPARHVTRDQLLGKPYVLNVFGSWCAECVHEHPVLMAQAQRLGVPLIGYNYKDAPADATAWLARLGNPYAMVLADETGQTAIDFGVYGAPESFLIDAHGMIRYKHIGVLTPDVINDELLPAIAALPRGAR
ncbi:MULTISPECIES: DsbE family thiol:disulfide interchange protein [unclassified Xanthomonas]|uniref:DsbE family thiol:disulfide interchange protein n=1 Tax=unclassified Xanthomonas TaxID=2643310 RepID=UPI000CEF2E71|nr:MULTISPECIES: DsbE family thiol:disulfide interchange protein [unclassified Xanthomonas]PPU36143.1 DsbE family thiol:disulfide interchange protein [Xanthomonas sp. CFBP 7912]RJS03214.1 DsbE family thiol:disulfide interchange protein [Xanthomonas sp. CFBP 7698]